MNIGIVTTWFERGAAYVSRQYLCLLQKENNVYIYARGGEACPSDNPLWNQPYVTWAKKDKRITGIILEEFRDWIYSNKLECILFNEQRYWEPVIFSKNLGVKIGAYIDYYQPHTVPLFELYDFLICNTRRHYSVFKDFPGAHYVPWGTDINLYKPMEKDICRKELTFFTSCGYAPARKGVDKIIRSFYEIHKCNSCKLIIHTQVNIQKAYPELIDIINSLQKENKLKIIEKSVTAPGLYYMGDVYVYPSVLDGIGLTIAEALASGLPVIVTDTPPMNEFAVAGASKTVSVEEYRTREDGYYWPLSYVSQDGLTDAMRYFIDNSDKLPEMQETARNYALLHLDWRKNKTIINDIFKNSPIRPIAENLVKKAREEDLKSISYMERLKKTVGNILHIEAMYKNIEDKEVYIYGAGTHTDRLLELTSILQKNIIGIIDKDFEGTVKAGIPILNPEILRGKKDCILIPSSFKWQDDICRDAVEKYGYKGELLRIYTAESKHVFWE